MIIDRSIVAYLAACVDAIEAGKPEIRKYLTNGCTECSEVFTGWLTSTFHGVPVEGSDGVWSGSHQIYFARGEEGSSDTIYVLIGCEGYLLVNPPALGLDQPNWQDWTVHQ